MMWKRGHKHKSWKERWLVLTPTHLNYYVTPKERVLKGSIVFDEECTVEVGIIQFFYRMCKRANKEQMVKHPLVLRVHTRRITETALVKQMCSSIPTSGHMDHCPRFTLTYNLITLFADFSLLTV